VGTQLWHPSGAGIWSSPTIYEEQQMVYATTGDSYSDPAANTSDAFVAFRMATGEFAWSRQMTPGLTISAAPCRSASATARGRTDRISISVLRRS
jgi:outer membrane protein assembly factor BamB